MATTSGGMPTKRVDDSLLKSGVAIMPGGEDQLGRALVAFPTTTPEMLRQRHTTAHLVLLLRYYVTLSDVIIQNGGLAIIANLTTYSSKDCLQIVVDTLDKLQAEVCGSVGVLYAILPRSKDAQKSLKKLLGLKPSKKNPKVPTYEAVLLENVPDLQRHIQRRHLTSEFGGTMTYNHRIWAQLTQDVADLDEAVTSTLRQVPEAVDKVTMMTEYDLPTSAAESEALLQQVRTKYNDIMRDINLEHLIDECKSLQEKLSAPHKYEGFNDITQTMVFREAKVKVVDYRTKLNKARERLKNLWQQAEDRVMLASKVNKYKQKAEKVTEWMQNVGMPTVNQDSDIADCLSKAEILKNHFETGFLTIAKNVLWLAEKILKKFEGLLQECGLNKQHPPGSGFNSQTEPILAYTRQFQATVEYFKRAVEKKHQVYLNVHAFFLSAVQASSDDKETSLSIYRQLQQLTKWYRKMLKFLPVQLLIPSNRVNYAKGQRPQTALPYISSAWRAAVEDFILHHPMPSSESITKMKNVIPVIDNINIRNQARLLISRVTMLRALLVTPENVTPHDLQDVLSWRDQLNHGQDEIYLSMTTSTLDLSKILTESSDTAVGGPSGQSGMLSARVWRDNARNGISSETESTSTTDGINYLGSNLALNTTASSTGASTMRTPKLKLSSSNYEGMYFEAQDGLSKTSSDKINGSVGKKQVHLRSPKKERHHNHTNSRYYSDPKLTHLSGQNCNNSAAVSGVPRLDLSGLTYAPKKSYTDRGGVVERQQSFGVYGDIAVDQTSKRPHRRRLGRSVQNLTSMVHEEDTSLLEPANKELYVSLDNLDEVGTASELPNTLKHIDVIALRHNLPQDQQTNSIESNLEGSAGKNGCPHSYESLADSGIANTQSSGASTSTNDFSPSLSTGQSRMSALHETDEQQLDALDTGGCSDKPKHVIPHTNGLPDLAYEKDGRLSLVQSNIDIIVNSPLSAEEKLKLMATLCECESVHSGQLSTDTNAPNDKKSKSSPGHSRSKLESIQGALDTSTVAVESTSKLIKNDSSKRLADVQNNDTQTSRPRTPKLSSGANNNKLFSRSHSQTPQRVLQNDNVITSNAPEPAKDQTAQLDSTTQRHRGPTEALINALQEGGIEGNHSSLGNYVREAGFGIDIEAWMRNQEEGSEVLLADAVEGQSTEDGMAEYIEKWKLARENRELEEEQLAKAREELDNLYVHEEQLKQDEVEQSLSRTHKLLQEQEAMLREEEQITIDPADALLLNTADNLQLDHSLPNSGTSTPAPYQRPGSALAFNSPDSLLIQSMDDDDVPSEYLHHNQMGQREFNMNSTGSTSGSGSPPRGEVYDSSVTSGESGVFTLNSADIRLMHALDAQNTAVNSGSFASIPTTPRHSLSNSWHPKHGPSQKELMLARGELLSVSLNSGRSSTKSGIVQQMDFRDMLRTINSGSKEEENDKLDKEFNQALEATDSLKYANILNQSIGNKCEHLATTTRKSQMAMNIDSATEQIEDRLPVSGHSQASNSEFKSVIEGTDELNNLQNSQMKVGYSENAVSSASGSDVMDDVFGSGDSTPVNTPRGGSTCGSSNNLKKWASFDLSEFKDSEDDNDVKNISSMAELAELQKETLDLLDDENNVLDSIPVIDMNESLNNEIGQESSQAMASPNIAFVVPSPPEQPKLGGSGSETGTDYAVDMKVTVGAGGGSACSNTFSMPSSSCMENFKTPIIIDNGSGMCKCGFANQDLPCAIFPALVGRAKYEDVSVGRMQESYVGSEAQGMRGVLTLKYPLEHGIITDWNDMELVWQHALEDQLRVHPAEHPVMVTEAPLNPKKNREHMMELLFETFQMPGVYFAIQAVLALYASGRTTGLVVDSGDGVSHFVPIYEGYSLPHAVKRVNLAGRDLTQYMVKLLYEQGKSFKTSAEHEIVRDMKELHCFVSSDFTSDMRKAETSCNLEELYELPDGSTVMLNSERFRCPEVLFNPSLIGMEHEGLHMSTRDCAMACEVDLRQDLFSNIVLSGGTTMLPGFGERLQEEVAAIVPSGLEASVKVTSPPDRYFSVWQGGAVLASMSTFKDSWVTYEEYLEYGSSIVHSKCF